MIELLVLQINCIPFQLKMFFILWGFRIIGDTLSKFDIKYKFQLVKPFNDKRKTLVQFETF